MQLPDGRECKHYYADYNRGRNIVECRLVKANPESLRWKPGDCKSCTVPEILNANASPNLELKVTIKTQLFGLQRKVSVSAQCIKHRIPVKNPYIGCEQCNAERPGLDIFKKALSDDD